MQEAVIITGYEGQGEEVELIDSVWKVSSILGQESYVTEAAVVEELNYLQDLGTEAGWALERSTTALQSPAWVSFWPSEQKSPTELSTDRVQSPGAQSRAVKNRVGAGRRQRKIGLLGTSGKQNSPRLCSRPGSTSAL